jgi:hypothetical protein
MLKSITRNRLSFFTVLFIFIILLLVHLYTTSGKFHFLEYLLCLGIFSAGTWFLRETLLFYVPDAVTAVTLLILAFGTNLFYLAGVDLLLQPVLLFSLYAAVIYLTALVHRSPGRTKTVLLAVASGIAVLVQAEGYQVLLIPALWGIHDLESAREKYSGAIRNYREMLVFIACLLVFVLAATVALRIRPGEIAFLDIRLPGFFIFTQRFFWNDLFSFDHGWLIYSPLVLLTAAGFYFLSERNREIFSALFGLCFLNLLIESNWTELGSTEVFGQVAFVPLIAVLSLPLAILLKVISEKKWHTRLVTGVIFILFILLNIFQTWQYREGIILRSGMTPDAYCAVFGRTHVPELERQILAGLEPDPALVLKDTMKFSRRTLAFYDFNEAAIPYDNGLRPTSEMDGRRAFKLDSTAPFSPALKAGYSELTKKKQVGARLTVSVFVPRGSSFKGATLVITSIHETTSYRYKSLNLDDLHLNPGQWMTVSFDYLSPIDPYPGDLLDFHVWYAGKEALYIDDLKFELFEPEH